MRRWATATTPRSWSWSQPRLAAAWAEAFALRNVPSIWSDLGAHRVIVGTAAFTPAIKEIAEAVGPERIHIALDSKNGKIVVKGWQEATDLTAEQVIGELEPYCSGFLCTYVDKEGMLQGTDLDWFRRLRNATSREITAAGGITTMDDVKALLDIDVHAALGMAIYTGKLDLNELARMLPKPKPSAKSPRTLPAGPWSPMRPAPCRSSNVHRELAATSASRAWLTS